MSDDSNQGQPKPDDRSRFSRVGMIRPTEEEFRQRVDEVLKAISLGLYPSQIKRHMVATYKVKPRTVEHYLRRARELLCLKLERPKIEHRQDSLAVYVGILQSKDAKPQDRIRAQEAIDRLLGLCEPIRMDARVDQHTHVTVRYDSMSEQELSALMATRMETLKRIAPNLLPGSIVETGEASGNGETADNGGNGHTDPPADGSNGKPGS